VKAVEVTTWYLEMLGPDGVRPSDPPEGEVHVVHEEVRDELLETLERRGA